MAVQNAIKPVNVLKIYETTFTESCVEKDTNLKKILKMSL